MIPNISKWKWLTRIKLRLYICPTTTQEKQKLLRSTTAEYQKLICSLWQSSLIEPYFYLQTFRKLRYLYKFLFQKTWIIWGHMNTSYLLHDLIRDSRTIMILLNFQIFTLVRKKHSTIFVHSDLKYSFIKFSINKLLLSRYFILSSILLFNIIFIFAFIK